VPCERTPTSLCPPLPTFMSVSHTDKRSIYIDRSVDTGRYEYPDDIASKNTVFHQRVGLIEWGQGPSHGLGMPSRRMPPFRMLINKQSVSGRLGLPWFLGEPGQRDRERTVCALQRVECEQSHVFCHV
jgi:hypothetical protein